MAPHSPFARSGVAPFDAMPKIPVTHALSRKARIDWYLDLAVRPHTQWSTRKAAMIELHTLTGRILDERTRFARLTPGPRYSEAAVHAFVEKLQQVVIFMPDTCGDCLALLDEALTAYLDGVRESFDAAIAEDEAAARQQEAA